VTITVVVEARIPSSFSLWECQDKIWSEMSEMDRKVVSAMAISGETNVSKLRELVGMTTSQFSVYRDRLKRKGIINTAQYGYISLLLPRFEEYVKLHIDL
jgi:hypothetical protein